MAALGVVLDDVFQALSKASAQRVRRHVERGAQMFVIRSIGTFTLARRHRQASASATTTGVPVQALATSRRSPSATRRARASSRAANNQDAVQGIVLMRRGENPSVVLEGLRAADRRVCTRARCREGVRIVPFYDRTELVDTTLDTVFHNLAEGALLVTACCSCSCCRVRASLIVALVIPLSLAASFIYLHARGMSREPAVDGRGRLRHHRRRRGDPRRARVRATPPGDEYQQHDAARSASSTIFNAAREVARPTLFSLLIIVAAYLPIFALQRVEGRIFAPMANTVVSALVGAMLVSFTLVPVLCFFALRRHEKVTRVAGAARRAQGVRPDAAAARCATRRAVLIAARRRSSAPASSSRRGSAPSSCPSSTRARSTSRSRCRPTCRSPRAAS